jgi:hypothetical protein
MVIGSFKMKSRKFLLTYPQGHKDSFTKESIMEGIRKKITLLSANCVSLLVSKEVVLGQKAGDRPFSQFHVLLKLDRVVIVDSDRFWDIGWLHGHYRKLSRKRGVWPATRARLKQCGAFIEVPAKQSGRAFSNFISEEVHDLSKLICMIFEKIITDSSNYKDMDLTIAVDQALRDASWEDNVLYELNRARIDAVLTHLLPMLL